MYFLLIDISKECKPNLIVTYIEPKFPITKGSGRPKISNQLFLQFTLSTYLYVYIAICKIFDGRYPIPSNLISPKVPFTFTHF